MFKQPALFSFLLIGLCLLTSCGNVSDGYPEASEYVSNEYTNNEAANTSTINAYTSLEKAQSAAGFAFMVPTNIPVGYTQDEISVVNNNASIIAQIDYKKEDNNLTYRVSQTTDTLNFDRNTYDKEKVIVVSDAEITCSCNEDIIFVATWQKNGCFYCILSDEGLDTTTLSVMIASIR